QLDSQLGGQLSAFEALWPEFYRITTSARTANTPSLPYDYGMYGLIETLGSDPQSDQARFEQALAEALEREIILDAVIAKSESERRALWGPREEVFEVEQRYGLTYNFDVSL